MQLTSSFCTDAARVSTAFGHERRQGADFVHLNRHHGVRVQTGGSDQWGNIVAGVQPSGILLYMFCEHDMLAAQSRADLSKAFNACPLLIYLRNAEAPCDRRCTLLLRSFVSGTDLIRKVEGSEEAEPCFGVTFPLLLKADGRKFGKSEEGAVWLAPGAPPLVCCGGPNADPTLP